MKREEMISAIESRISTRRMHHTLGVEKEAVRLAKRYGANEKNASVAALLHDVAKACDKEQLIKLAEQYNVKFDIYEMHEQQLMHGPVGAAIAKHEFGVKSRDALKAIEYHTTGRKNMSLIEKIIYIADLIEPSREFEGKQKIRRLADENIDYALQFALRREIVHVTECNQLLHPRSVEALNHLVLSREAQG